MAPQALEDLSHCTVRLEITQADLEAVRSRVVVTKVMHLTNASNSLAAPNNGVTTFDRCATVSSTELGNTADPLAIAEQRGPIVAVFRMSNEQPQIAEDNKSSSSLAAPGTLPSVAVPDSAPQPSSSVPDRKKDEAFHVNIPTDVEEFLKQQPELNQFVTSIPDDEHYQSNFRKALGASLKASAQQLSTNRDRVLVVGRVNIPAQAEDLCITGNIILLRGGYFLAACHKRPEAMIRFFAIDRKPISIPINARDDRRVLSLACLTLFLRKQATASRSFYVLSMTGVPEFWLRM